MSITAFGAGARVALNATTSFKNLKNTLGTLQTQLSTGRTAETSAGLGAGAPASLRLNARLSTLEGYDAAIDDAQFRTTLATTGLQDISDLAHGLASTLAGTSALVASDRDRAQIAAKGVLAGAIDDLNADVNGRYLFSGRAADTEPVVALGIMLNGDATRAGLQQLVSQRQAADLGTAGLGRLTTALASTSVALSEEAAGLPFGFKIAGAAATGTGLTATGPTGSPATVTVSVGTQPNQGDAVSFDLTLPDGSTTTLTLSADATGSGEAGTFAIGATTNATAANIKSALDATLATLATTSLSSASALRASTDFFGGSQSAPPPRVSGTSPGGPTTYAVGSAANTVIWYQGDDDTGSARETAPVQIGDNQSVAIGLRANESGVRQVLAAAGALAVGGFPASDTSSVLRFKTLSKTLANALIGPGGAPKVDSMIYDLGTASATLKVGSERVTASKAQVQNMADIIDTTTPAEVAAKILATQTLLQASYQTTSTIARLSLVDYL